MKPNRLKKGIALFIIIFVSVAMVAETILLLASMRNMKVLQENHTASAQAYTDNITAKFGDAFAAGIRTVNSIFEQRWYKHFRNIAGYYDHEFDATARIEIVRHVAALYNSFPFAAELLVITPSKDTVISSKGWFTIGMYTKLYGGISLSDPNPADRSFCVTSTTHNGIILVNDYTARRDKTIIAVLIDSDKFAKYMMNVLDPRVESVCAELEEQNFVSIGSLESSAVIMEGVYKSPALRFRMGFRAYDINKEKQIFILLSCLLLVTVFLLAVLLSRYAMRPVRVIIQALGGKTEDSDHPYEYVRAYIERTRELEADHGKGFSDDGADINRFMIRAREDILFGLLNNPDFHFDEDVMLALPWLNERLPMCLVMNAAANDHVTASLDAIECKSAHRVSVQNGTMTVALLWLPPHWDDPANIAYVHHVRKEWQTTTNAVCMVSPLFAAYRETYSRQKLLLAEMRGALADSSALPRSAKEAIRRMLRDRNWLDLADLIEQLRQQYAADDILTPLLRMSGCPRGMVTADMDHAKWEEVLGQLQRCADGNTQSQDDDGRSATAYLLYIDQHYADTNLCIEHLADHFGRHRTLISKDIKAQSGLTFTEYLRDRRMDAAIKAITAGQRTMAEAARIAGFGSYTAFRRAFQQKMGSSPAEYRDRQRAAAYQAK